MKREFYSVCTFSDAVADISGQQSKVFIDFDALKGYHQRQLDKQSQFLTTFMTLLIVLDFYGHPLVIVPYQSIITRDVAFTPQTPQLGGAGQLWGPKLV